MFARDNAGNLLHPTGKPLAASRVEWYEIFIEMTAQATENMAGKFIVENSGQDGKHSILSNHIYVATIDKRILRTGRACRHSSRSKSWRTKNDMPRSWMTIEHAVRTLQDPGYALP